MTALSLCVIARNEERVIERCLRSVRDHVDEMIVVDTGSEDATPELARRLGATVFTFPWTGDFSEARNHSLAQAKGEWILVVDSDEMLAERDARRLRQVTSNTRADGFKLTQRTYLQNANYVCASSNPGDYAEGLDYTDCIDIGVIRLFRKDSRIRYHGRVHELVEPAFLAAPSLTWENSGLVLHHFGKVGDPATLERKKLLYLDLGRKKANECPSDALAQFELGVQLYELERFSECIVFFEAAVKLNSAFDLALLYIAKALHILGRMDEAAKHFRDCLKLSPNNDKVLFDYANFTRDRGDIKAALKLYQRAIAANPKHSLALFNLGALHIHNGDANRGLSFIERAIRLNPDNVSFHENLARLCLAFPGLDASIPLLEDYVQRFPKAVDCRSILAEIYFKSHQFDKAADMADHAIALESPKLQVLLTSAKANFSRRNLDAAESSYRSALLRDPLNLDSMMNLAAIAEIRLEDSAARSWYLRILDTYPGQPLALKRLAAAQIKAGLDEEVASVLERACAIDSIDPQSLILVGSLFEKAGKVDRAAALYRSAATKKPEWAQTVNKRVEQLQLSSDDGGIS